jgi:hypothetical protein
VNPARSVDEMEREVLEAIERTVAKEPQITPLEPAYVNSDVVRSETSFGTAAHLRSEFHKLLYVMEGDGLVKVITNGDDCVVGILPLGGKRLMMSEEEWKARQHPSPAQNISNTFHGDVRGFAQTTGSHSPIQQSISGVDVKEILPLVEQLRTELTKHPEVPADTHAEVDHIEVELRKEHPNPGRITGYLDEIKRVAGTIGAVLGTIESIRHFLQTLSH